MSRQNVEDIYRLTPIQQGILFHCLYDPGAVAYFEQFHVTTDDPEGASGIAEIWQQLVSRHTALRTSFLWEGLDEPLQVVHKAVEVPVRIYDWQDTPAEDRAGRIEKFLEADRREGFDLQQAPLLRITVLRWTASQFTLVLSYHHLVMDGWAFGILSKEVGELAAAYRAGKPGVLPEPRPFREYIAWYRKQDPEMAAAYWRKVVADFTGPTPLGWEPVAGGRARQAADFGLLEIRLEADETARLQAMARQARLTLNTVFQAAWAHVLACGSGQRVVYMGATVSGRPLALRGSQEMVGCFINTLPLRIPVPERGDIAAWLRPLQVDQVELRKYEHTALVDVRRWAGIPGDRELFDSIVVFENFNVALIEAASENAVQRFQRTNYPLTVVVEPTRELVVAMTFDRLRLAVADVERMRDHLEETLRALAAGARDLADLPAAPRRDRERLAAWNATTVDFGAADETLVSLFESQVDRTPEALGHPAATTRLHVLDAQGRPAPVGVPGELVIGGPEVGRGYRGLAAATAEKFVPDPFAAEPGARLYRTGALARWVRKEEAAAAADLRAGRSGHLEYLGRIDAGAERYWRKRLGSVTRPTPLGVDRPPSGTDEGHGAVCHGLSEAASAALAAFAQAHRLRLETLLVGAWAALLGRLSGQDEVVFGLGTLPVRVDLEPREALLSWLGRLQGDQTELRRFAGSPLDEVLGWSGVPRSQPLFESLLVFEGAGVGHRPSCPLTIVVVPGARIELRMEFARARLDEATVRRLLGHLETLLTTLPEVVAAGTRLADWPLLSAAEERAVLAAGARRAEFPSEDSLASRFARQVAARPEAPAVSFEGATWTYGELDSRARRLAHRLRALGVGPDVPVGIVAERSLELVAGLLAIVQAGGAYVPLDPASPPERLAFQIADSGAAAILVQPGLEGRLGAPGGVVVALDSSGEDTPPPLASELVADELAYIIYTSGSTGLPKGSLLTQRNVLRLFDATAQWFDFGPDDVWTLFHSYAFDFSVWEMWGALLYGGRLVVVPYWVSRAPESFHELLAREGVTVLNQTPSAFRQLVTADLERPPSELARLRTVVFGGEALEPTALAPWYERHGESATLVNMYGITETTVHVTYRPLLPADAAVAGASPVGVPIPDLEIFLLDRLGRPVPVGVAGEIHVGGAGLARGYLGRPGLTAERFVPSPFGPPGARLYRSGDLARRRPFDEGGELEFLGRIDHQVKIRGFRIELGEIEAALLAHPSVSQAAVVVRDDGGDRRLVGYVVAAPGATVSAAELKAHAGARLNDYMVPAAIVELAALPLTVNGKLDRAALPAPDLAPAQGGEREAPRGAVEEAVAAVWSEVLGVPVTSRHDDFFELGGHSLLATKVLSRLKQRLGVTLPLRVLFEAATVAATARAVADLEQGEGAPAAATAIPRLPRGGPLPLSFGQERLWFLDRLEPGSATYNVPFALRLEGVLDLGRLSRALAGVFARHEALRTSFAEGADGAPVQVIAETVVAEFPVIDLSGLAAAERERVAAEIAGREAAREFDLARGPLARFVLLRLAERSHAALWTAHHIVSDGWSTGVFLADLAALYQGAALPPLALQPADFAAWQRSHLDLDAELRFWREALAGAPTFLPLPTDRPRPPVMTYRGRAVPFRLPAATSEALRALAGKSGATPFMVFLAAFGGVLGRSAGVTDLLVGSPSAGRRRFETENLVGFFVNTLILRTQLAGSPSFSALLAQAKDATLAAYAHEDVPFEKVVEELTPGRSLAHSPLFQTMLSLEAGRGAGIDHGDLTIGAQPQPIRVSKFDLTLAVVDSGSGPFGGHWAFASDLFDPTTVLRWGERLATVLAAVTADPKLPLAAWPLLTRAEQHAVAREWNDPRVEYSDSGALLPELFRRRAAAHPDRVALVTDDGTVSYGELAARAHAVAQQLVARGVGPETIVGITIPRSPALVAGLLGILESGAAYLPIDPELPEERQRFLSEDSGAALVLTAADLAVEPLPGAPLPPVDLEPGHPAYVIYTSGSTGVPKGVVVTHGALVNRLLFALENDVDADSVFLQKTTASFDVSLLEIFAPLLAGGRTVLAKPGGAADPEYLLRRIAEAEVTHTSFPPTLLGELLAAGRLRELPSLKSVVTGGEVVPVELVGRFFGKDDKDTNDTNDENDKSDGDAPSDVVSVPGVLGVLSSSSPALFNRYGPTEATISVTSWTCRSHPAERVLPIGRPTAKAEIHLLDRAGRPVPVGVPGELHVGGPPVARGYLRRPGKTAEVFVPDAFSGRPGARLYKTGDLARYRPDGALEFVGRIDNQVKIRGFRVELGEIEAALLRHEAVRDAAVVDWGEGNAKTLAAYLVATNGHGPTDHDLRSRLGTSLPPHMVPSSYHWLESLPLTPSGKVDRRALPAPGGGPAVADEPPAGATEQRLAAIWSEVLGLDVVGRHADFFALGGHSLLATRVVSRVRAAFGAELPLRALFEAPTVAGLARELDRLVAAETGASERPPLVATPRAGELPLSFAQERLWFLERLDGGRGTYNLSVAVGLGGVLDPERLERALGQVVARHESLRTTFHSGPTGAPEQRIAAELAVPIRRDDSLLGFTGELEPEVERVAAAEADEPFDLSAGPLLRARLLALAADDHVFVLTVHHLISDGWSTQVLLREVVHGYRSAAPLPPLPVQYVDFARWQRSWLTGDELDRQLGYWRQMLAGAPPVLDLPLDRPRPPVAGAQGRRQAVQLSGPWQGRLSELLAATGTTPFMALLAAWGAFLGRLAGVDRVIVGAPVAYRNQPEIEGLIGFFVNTLALPVDLSGAPSFGDLLARARQVTLGAYEHQDLPFQKLVAELAPTRSRSHSPIFQVMLVLQNTAAAAMEEEAEEPGGLTMRTLPPAGSTTPFDLTLALSEAAEGFSGFLSSKTELFEATTTARWAAGLGRFLAAAVAHPERPVAALPWLSAAEEHQLRHEWNDTARDFRPVTVTELVAAWAAATPDAVAVVDPEGRAFCYRELLARADALAAALREHGAGPETVVAVAFERGIEQVVALLGVLRSGAAYLPLEIAHPDERLAELLADAAPLAVVASAGQARRFPGAITLPDGDGHALAPGTPEPASLAYLIYTSGSTGKPKAVAVPHRALAERLAMMAELFEFAPGDRQLQFVSVAFDMAVEEIFATLAAGATLVLAPATAIKKPSDLLAFAARHAVTKMNLPASLWHQIADDVAAGTVALPATLRVLVTGAEAASPNQFATLLRAAPAGLTAFNLYGPTETTIIAAGTRLPAADELASRAAVPLGRPLPGARLAVVDAGLRRVPIGVAGELLITGDGMARGYLGRPGLTAERFVPDADSELPGARAYRTGDRVRVAADGQLEFLGRLDEQVKIRGFRIELGEIEEHLRHHPAVAEAAVAARGERLVAYLVAESGQAVPNVSALRAFLVERLPEALVPAVFVTLPALPRSASGKVDRRSLPNPDAARPELAGAYQAPETELERLLVELVAEVVGVERPGVLDNFFDLGGDSLKGAVLVNRLELALGESVYITALFDTAHLRELASYLELHYPQSVAALSGPFSSLPRRRAALVGTTDDGADAPLSFGQERLWFLERLGAGGVAYHLPTTLAITGEVDGEVLGHALTALVARHEALRTSFAEGLAGPVQRIAPAAPVSLERVAVADEAAAVAAAVAFARRPFDLGAGSLFRAAWISRGTRDHLLVLVLHHIVADGWSLGLVVREFAELYGAFAAGQPDPLPPLAVRYVDFARWQRQLRDAGELARQGEFWVGTLAGVPPLELPTDHPRPAVQRFRGTGLASSLPVPAGTALLELARRLRTSPFVVLSTLFSTLLARLSGLDDFAVGTPVAGRNRRELEGLVGFFVNTLALRCRYSPAESFRAAVLRARGDFGLALENQDLPFEHLVELLRPERHLSRSPVFQVLFSLQDLPAGEALAVGELGFRPVELEVSTSKFDLALAAITTGGRVSLRWVFDSDLFDAATVAEWAATFERLAEAVAADPERPLGTIDLLSAAERTEMLTLVRQAAAPYPRERTLAALIEARVDLTPDAPALVVGSERLSYRELDRRANAVAERLAALGCGPEDRVGVVLERGAVLPIALLGVLKSGAAYVPLDPGFPRERLAYVLADAGVRVVITEPALADSLGELVPSTTAWLVLDPAAPPAATDHRCGREDDPESAAYVLYTSGSTGRPKGVAVPHRALVNFLVAMADRLGFAAGHSLLAVTTVSFDIAALELWLPLLTGGQVVLATSAEVTDGVALGHRLVASGATHLQATPATWRLLLEVGAWPVPGVTALCGGEALPRELAGRLGPVWNLYGPTETTVWSAATRITSGDGAVPFGEAIANTELWVTDRAGLRVATGIDGELVIGGDGVARGYLGQPALTAERFVPDAFSGRPGARLYRTGDRVRRRRDGQFDFLGRLDFQVKLRGFRIELGDIEAALAAHPALAEVAAALDHPAGGEPRLVAWTVARAEAPAAEELRRHLAERLPSYMIPAVFVALPALPRTPNNKLDRRRLVVPELEPAGAAELRTATEEAVAAAFCELLGLPKADRNDSFFARGGHSLLAARLLTRLRRDLGVELPLRRVFETPTVAEIARAIDESGGAAYEAIPRGLAPDGPVPASFGQARMWFLDRLSPNRASQNLPVSLRLRGPLDGAAFERAAVALEAHHEGLRTVFVAGPTGPLQVQRPPGSVVLERVDLTDLPVEEREARAQQIVQAAAWQPFDLAAGPLVRWLLVQTAPDSHRLAVVMHHIVADGWSIDLLVRDLAQLYGAERGGQTLELPPLPLRYADFAVWQRAWFESPAARQDEDYWRTALARVPTRLNLPTDRPRPTLARGRGRTIVGELPAETTALLTRQAAERGATPFLVLLAAYSAVLGRLAGEDDLVVGTPVAGRSRSELEGLVGLFLNTLPLRTRVELEGSFADHLTRLTRSTLDAFAHQGLPFEHLLELLEVPRTLAHTPLFQVFLALQNLPAGERPAADLTIEEVPLAGGNAAFDLTLAVAPRQERLSLAWTFDSDLFDDVTIERFAARFTAVLTAALAEPERRLADLPWLLPVEEVELRRFGLESRAVGSRSLAPAAATLHGLVAAQAERDGAAPALAGRNLAGAWEELDYAALLGRARQLAGRLVAAGLTPEERVAICLPRSIETIVAVLAVLAAGGAYVPLDPALPGERKRFVVGDAQVRTVITLAAGADEWGVARVVTPEWAGAAAATPLPAVDPSQAAYVIYTSGSTGQPKGVVVEHHAAVAYVTAAAAALGHGPGDRALQFASLAFDASVDEIFNALGSGAALVLKDTEGVGSGHEFFDFLERHRVSVAGVIPTAYWHVLAQGLPAAPPPSLRCVTFGGERALASAYAAWRAWLPAGVRLANAYGPTETVVAATRWENVEAGSDQDLGDPPIGRPVGGVRAYVLDAAGRLVPRGVPGELCLGGQGLARGYLEQPATTAGRFRPDPWSATPGGRYYRTGDVVRWTAEGDLQYIGRLDFQVKLRGFRIELDEIAVALERHPAVAAATVVVDGGPNGGATGGEGRLVAYVASSTPPPVAELRAFVAERLPAYMVPAVFVALPALPLTPTGKVDRAALPRPELGEPLLAPRTALEAAVLACFQAALPATAELGVESDFFASGGSSLGAALLVQRLGAALGAAVPVVAVFERSTPAAFSAWLESEHPQAALRFAAGTAGPAVDLPPAVVALAPGEPGRVPWWFVHPLSGEVSFYRHLVEAVTARTPGQPIFGFEAPGLRGGAPLATLEAMAAVYVDGLEALWPSGEIRLAGSSLGGSIVWEMARQLTARGRRPSTVVLIDAKHPAASAVEPILEISTAALLFSHLGGRPASVVAPEIVGLGPEELLLRLRTEAPGLPASFGLEDLARILAVLEANSSAYAAYRPQAYDGPVRFLRATEGAPEVPFDTAWKPLAPAGLEVVDVPGGHLSMHRPPYVEALAALLVPED